MYMYAQAIRKYFTGESREEVISRFEELDRVINTSRDELKSLVKGLNDVISDTDSIKKAASIVTESSEATSEAIAIASDNIKYSNHSLVSHVDGFKHSIQKCSAELNKAESDMVKILEKNPNIISIIHDVNHDKNLEKSLVLVMQAYKSGDIDRDLAVSAYKSAVSNRRTDVDFSEVLNSYLKDK